MEHEKSFIYTLILGACMLISLAMIGKMLLYEPVPMHTPHAITRVAPYTQNDKQEDTMIITEQEAAELLSARLPDDFAVSDLSVAIGADGLLCAQGTVQKSSIAAHLDQGLARSALLFLPDSFELRIECTVHYQNDAVVLTPKSFSAGTLELSGDVLPASFVQMFNTALNEALHSRMGSYASIRMGEGEIELLA